MQGSEVIKLALDKPRNISYKGAADLVTDTDNKTELAVVARIREAFPDHLLLGEEGGVSGDPSSEYLWCIDPLDGTTNFAHGYPCFATSVAVLCKGRPVAACVVGGGDPSVLLQPTVVACDAFRLGATCNGNAIKPSDTDQVEKSLLTTGFGYNHNEAWSTNLELFREFTDISRGVRRLGAAAVDMCHVALGIVDAYWEFQLKPWDMAAGVLIVEESGGKVTRMDGGDFTVFDRSVLVSNSKLHDQLLQRIAPPTEELKSKGFDFTHWYKPDGYHCAADV
eukprot:SM000031S11546  [mRNA]  locus=s31:222708:224699:- [translate_table: standard]